MSRLSAVLSPPSWGSATCDKVFELIVVILTTQRVMGLTNSMHGLYMRAASERHLPLLVRKLLHQQTGGGTRAAVLSAAGKCITSTALGLDRGGLSPVRVVAVCGCG